jgi:D-glycero-D-manno-heptose 1,7-bisphosphate phosphatase
VAVPVYRRVRRLYARAMEREAVPTPMIGADGVCEWLLREPARRAGGADEGGPALFVDRDGVLVEEVHYLHRPGDVAMLPGAISLVAWANTRAIPVIVVTNQSGVGRGMYGWDEFGAVQAEIDARLAEVGAHVNAVFACPYHRDAQPPYDVDGHPARKPGPGMLLRAAELMHVDLTESWLVGDTVTDIEAAIAAGLAGAIHVLTGHGEHDRPAVEQLAPEHFDLRLVEEPGDAGPLLDGLIPRIV